MSDATDDLEYAESGEKARFAKINREIGIVGPKPTENETELSKAIQDLYISCSRKVYGKYYLDDLSFFPKLEALITSDKQRLLQELMEQKVDLYNAAHISSATPGPYIKIEAVPIEVIQNKLEGLS